MMPVYLGDLCYRCLCVPIVVLYFGRYSCCVVMCIFPHIVIVRLHVFVIFYSYMFKAVVTIVICRLRVCHRRCVVIGHFIVWLLIGLLHYYDIVAVFFIIDVVFVYCRNRYFRRR